MNQLLKDKKISAKEFAKSVGVHEMSVSRWKKTAHLSTDVIEQITTALDMEFVEFFLTPETLADLCNISPGMLEICKEIEKMPPVSQKKFIRHMLTGIDLLSG